MRSTRTGLALPCVPGRAAGTALFFLLVKYPKPPRSADPSSCTRHGLAAQCSYPAGGEPAGGLKARRAAVRAVEAELSREIGADALAGLYQLLDVLAGPSVSAAERRSIARQAAAVADTLAWSADDETEEDAAT